MAKKAIVVPCFNEAARLDGDAFLRQASETLRFVFVDDGSTDGTAAVLARLAEASPYCEVLSLPRNVGKAEAVRHGLVHVLPGADLVGYFDADLATPLAELPAMEAHFAEPSVVAVTGARVQLSGTEIERQRLRHYTGRIFATAAALALGAPFYDTQCGAKLFRVTPALVEALGTPFHSAWFFDVELIGRLLDSGVVREHPLRQWRDVGGSKVKATTFVRAPFELARLSVELGRWRRFRRGGPASSS